MNFERRVGLLASAAGLIVVVLALRIVYWQMLRADQLLPAWLNPSLLADSSGRSPGPTDLNGLPQPLLQRSAVLLSEITRGPIYDRNGVLLASDQPGPDGTPRRFYAEPSLAPVLGYTSAYRTGLAGLELSENETLLGLDRIDARFDELLHQPVVGSSLTLTIDSALQRSADRMLAGKAGAAVVLDAKTGAVLAMASSPHFDPNQVLDEGYAAGLESACGGAPTCSAPFLNRATQALYTPGSIFKTVVLIAGLDTGQLQPDMVFDFGKPRTGPSGTYYVYNVTGGGTIVDYNHREARLSLAQSFADSANAAFAKIGDEMPPAVLVQYAERFGFSAQAGKTLPFEIDTSSSQLATSVQDLYSNNMLRASTAIGQGQLLTSPLNMAEVVLAVVNGGNLPEPYLVQRVQDPSGRVIRQHAQQLEHGLMKPETAQVVQNMMVGVVKNGTGWNAAVPGLVTGGKTGTAQLGGNAAPHAWFAGFAQGKDRGVVIAVVIENGGEGAYTAAPIFARLAKQALLP